MKRKEKHLIIDIHFLSQLQINYPGNFEFFTSNNLKSGLNFLSDFFLVLL
jgi:hypothetical protein